MNNIAPPSYHCKNQSNTICIKKDSLPAPFLRTEPPPPIYLSKDQPLPIYIPPVTYLRKEPPSLDKNPPPPIYLTKDQPLPVSIPPVTYQHKNPHSTITLKKESNNRHIAAKTLNQQLTLQQINVSSFCLFNQPFSSQYAFKNGQPANISVHPQNSTVTPLVKMQDVYEDNKQPTPISTVTPLVKMQDSCKNNEESITEDEIN